MELTGYNRCYAAYLLRSHGRKIRISKHTVIVGDVTKKAARVGHKTYDERVFHVLKKIWFIIDCICGKRLATVKSHRFSEETIMAPRPLQKKRRLGL